MDLLRQTFESFNPNQMTTQINVPNGHLSAFIEKCELMQITYHQIEARENDTRYEVITQTTYQIYHLGCAVGMTIAHRDAMNVIDNFYGK